MSDDAILYLCITVVICVLIASPFFNKRRKQHRTEITVTKTIGDSSVSETTITTEDL